MSEFLDEKASEMFDILAAHPDGVVRDDLMDMLHIDDVGLFHGVKGALQDMLGGSDEIQVVGDSSTSMSGGWTWKLAGDPDDADSVRYGQQKIRNIYGRQRRAYMVALALARGTDGRTAKGRLARRLVRSQFRVLEDTVDVMGEMGMPNIPDLSLLPTLGSSSSSGSSGGTATAV